MADAQAVLAEAGLEMEVVNDPSEQSVPVQLFTADDLALPFQDWQPSFLQSNSEATIDSDRSHYVRTDDMDDAVEALDTHGRVVLCGPPGSGKTSLGHALLRRYRRRGFKPYVIARLQDWHMHIGEGRQSIALMDGALGQVRVDWNKYKQWQAIARSVRELNRTRGCLLVLTLYPHILRELHVLDVDSDSPLLQSMVVVHLMKDPLDKELKREMLTSHLKQLHLDTAEQDVLVTEILQNDISGAAFPWCCQQLVKMLKSRPSGISSDDETTPLFQRQLDYSGIFTTPFEAHVALLQRMLRDPEHGEAFAAVVSMTMLGFGRFLLNPRRVQQQLETLGFRNCSVDCLEGYADILKGSFLAEKENTFFSRVIYDAVGLALGRSFRQPTLLKVCDVRFLVQYVRTKEAATEVSITIGPSPDDRQLLMQTMYDHVVRGRLPEVCQHPSLHCPQFLQEFEAFCQRQNLIQQLINATDADFGMSLLYWSAWCMSRELTTWCLSLMDRETLKVRRVDSNQIFSATIVSALLENTIAQYTPRAKLAWKVLQRMSPLRSSSYDQAFNLPLPSSSQRVTQDLESLRNRVIMHLQSANLCYLGDHSLPIPVNLINVVRITREDGDKVCVFVRNKQWYLALRLLTDREVDERDEEGNTLLHVATDTADSDAVKVAVESGASLTATNNKGHTPTKLACNRRNKRQKKSLSNSRTFLEACAAGDAEKVKVLLCTGATVHDRDREGNTPLHSACKAGKTDLATLLISLGADVNARNKDGVRPNVCAHSNRHVDTAVLSERNTANTNMENDEGGTYVYSESRCTFTLLMTFIVIIGVLFAVFGLCMVMSSVNTKSDTGTDRFRSSSKAGFGEKHVITENLNQLNAFVNMRTNAGYTPLHAASALGQTDVFRLLLENGGCNYAAINIQGVDDGCSALHLTSAMGSLDTVRLLLKSGAEVNLKNAIGRTPLHFACMVGRTEVARILLQNMADTNTKDNAGVSPLHEAALRNHTETVLLLVRHGADVNVKSDLGFTPLHFASKNGRTEIAELLVHSKADVNVQTKDGVTPLFIAIFKDHLKTARLLITNNADINSTNEQLNDTTLLHTAIQFRRTEIVKLMLQNNVNISVKDVQGLTPLHYACFQNYTEMVRLFVEHGADVNAKGGDFTPLQIACKSGLTEIANILIQNNADMNVTYNENKDTLLHFVHWYDKNDIVRLLIHNGADLNAKNAKGLTPLHMAVMFNKSELTLLLLQNKANPNIRSYGDGDTALQFAINFNHTKIVSLLLQYGADPDARDIKGFAPLHIFSLKGHTAIVQLLVQAGADVNADDSVERTPLHYACMEGQAEAARLLIQGGADVNAKAEDGLRPLHCAASSSNTETVRVLLQNDADSQVVDDNGFTALHRAAESGNKEVAQTVLESNPGIVNMRSVTGMSALHVACLHGHEQVARFLIHSKADVNLITPIAALLIQNKAHVNAFAFNGQTPLDVAYQQGQTLLATFLTKHGAKRFKDL